MVNETLATGRQSDNQEITRQLLDAVNNASAALCFLTGTLYNSEHSPTFKGLDEIELQGLRHTLDGVMDRLGEAAVDARARLDRINANPELRPIKLF